MSSIQGTAWTLVAALATVLLGVRINRKFAFLERLNLPPAVTAGLLLSGLTAALHHSGIVDLRLDPAPREWLLLVFFVTLGLGARFSRLALAGRSALVLCVAIAVLAVAQNLAGLALAWLYGAPTALGLFVGSAAYLGGHGTATAWAGTAQAAHLDGALETGLGSATLGLVFGALVAGPVASRLARRAAGQPATDTTHVSMPTAAASPGVLDTARWLPPLLAIVFCVAAGGPLGAALSAIGLPIPAFLAVLVCAVALTNFMDALLRPVDTQLTDIAGGISLNAFLAIAMLTLDWAALAHQLPLLLTSAAVQTATTCAIAVLLVFPWFGRDRDAAAACGGFIGLGLGAMPIGLAVMRRLNEQLGDTPRALLAVTLSASLFTDAANSVIILLVLRVAG